MRYSTRSLLVLISLLAVILPVVRYAWVQWPGGTLSFAIGVGVWGCIILAAYLRLGPNVSRLFRGGVLSILNGALWLLAFWISPQLLWLFVGYAAGALATIAVQPHALAFLAWAGFAPDRHA